MPVRLNDLQGDARAVKQRRMLPVGLGNLSTHWELTKNTQEHISRLLDSEPETEPSFHKFPQQANSTCDAPRLLWSNY